MIRLVKFDSEPSFNNLFNRFFEGELGDSSNRPTTNIKENDEAFELNILIPGFKKEQVHIEIDEHILNITAEQEAKDEEQEWLKEFSFDSLNRSFRLPKNIDIESVEAEQRDGILHIKIPKKKEEQKLKKQIAIA
ncbi:MAG: Hsp20/alpha crystallin family protein [Bacteroidales bacterium]|nr:Hsp20/alpha crystallin family protein [Bacteroidales bacterium]